MKKVKILSFASLPIVMALLAGCGHEHTFSSEWTFDAEKHWHDATCEHKDQRSGEGSHEFGDDTICDICGYDSASHEVTADEWLASFGLDKRYYIADNYKAKFEVKLSENDITSEEATVDGAKVKLVASGKVQGQEMPPETEYCNDTGSNYDAYVFEDNKWVIHSLARTPQNNPMTTFASFFTPYQNFNDFEYDSASGTYKLKAGIEKSVQPFGKISDVTISFLNKKVSGISFGVVNGQQTGTFTGSVTYGGQTVTLPTVDPTTDPYFAYILDGGAPVRMSNTKEINNLEMHSGSHISFVYVNGQQTSALTNVTIEGDNEFGFGVSDGVLSSALDGSFSFALLNATETSCSVCIFGVIDTKYVGFVTVSGIPGSQSSSFMFERVNGGYIEYSCGTQTVPEIAATITLQIKKGEEAQAVTLLESAANADFELSGDGTTLTYKAKGENSYSFLLKESILDGSLSLLIEKQSSPTPVGAPVIMGSFDEWSTGIQMSPVTPGSTEFFAEVEVDALGTIKVVDDSGSYIDSWKTTGGENNAFEMGLASLDNDNNAKFELKGTYMVYFETDTQGNYGVFIRVNKSAIEKPFMGHASTPLGDQDVAFRFNSINATTVEYWINNVPAAQTVSYEVYAVGTTTPLNFVVEDSPFKSHLTITDSKITVKDNIQTELNIYLKVDRTSSALTVYIEECGKDPITYNTLYLAPGDWANDGATFYAYFYDSTSAKTAIWVALIVDNDLYKVDKEEGYDKVIFVRCDPAKDPFVDGWGAKWNQTDDLDVPTDANIKCTITGWGNPGENSPCTWGTK